MSQNAHNAQGADNQRIDKSLVMITLVATVLALAWAACDAAGFISIMMSAKNYVTEKLGWFFLLSVFLFVPFLLFLAFSKYGEMRLGKEDDRPEFSTFSWVALLFGAGLGTGYVFWPFAESLWHFYNTPYLAESGSKAAYIASKGATMLHWGYQQWAIYAVVALVIAFPAFRKNRPMTVAGSFYGILGDKCYTCFWGRAAEALSTITALWGAAAANCLGLMLFTVGLKQIFGLEVDMVGNAIIMFLIILSYTLAAYSGLHKGIKFISDSNAWLAMVLFTFILIWGPTSHLLNGMVETIGQYFNYYFSMSLYADSQNISKGWSREWTVFYWLWNTSWAPFVGGFIARISRGRTIRQFILGVLILPVAVSFAWFGVLTTATQYVDAQQLINVWQQVQINPANGPYAVASAFGGGTIMNIVIFLSVAGFLITSADAAAFFVAIQTSYGNLEPRKIMVLVWGFAIGAISIVLLNTNGIDGVKFAGVLAGVPFLLMIWIMIYSFWKTLNEEYDAFKTKKEQEYIEEIKKQILSSVEKNA